MDRASLFVAVAALVAIVSGGTAFLHPGWQAGATAAAAVLTAIIAIPLMDRPEVRIQRRPLLRDFACVLAAGGLAVAGAYLPDGRLQWGSVLLQAAPATSIARLTWKGLNRPKLVKAGVGVVWLAVFALNIAVAVRHAGWVGERIYTAVEPWFPEKPRPPQPAPSPATPPRPSLPPGTPVATVGGFRITPEMLDYQLFITSEVTPDATRDRGDALAGLLQAYVARHILDRQFQALDRAELENEKNWIETQGRESETVRRIRRRASREMFLDVYIGANGFYLRRLREVFDRLKREGKDQGAEDFWVWFRARSEGCVIEIPDPALRQECLRRATNVRHLIKN